MTEKLVRVRRALKEILLVLSSVIRDLLSTTCAVYYAGANINSRVRPRATLELIFILERWVWILRVAHHMSLNKPLD